MSKILGIDLGTTNSAMAIVEGGQPKVINSSEGENVTPSVVDPIKRVVGRVAKRQAVVNPKNTIFSVKRLMGKRFDDKTVQEDIKWLPYTVKAGSNGLAVVEVDGKEFTPQEISAMILQKLKADAEAFLGEKITEAVITVPAYFDDAQRQATKQAGEIAGLNVQRIINEPTAASLAYGLDKKAAETIIVYDLGGGTFDVSVLEVGDGVFEVKSTSGDTHLGGDDFDQKIIDWLVTEFKADQGVDLAGDKQAMQRLKEAAEKAKIELSSTQEAEINIPYITADASGPKHLLMRLSRSKLEQLVGDLIDRTFRSVEQALSDAKVDKSAVNEVVLVGGMTRMPAVVDRVKSFFGKDPHRGINPDEVVAVGAAIQGAVLSGEVKDVVLLDVTPLTLGVETLGGVLTPMIARNTTVPTSKTEVYSTAADNQTSVGIHVLQGERQMAGDNKSLGQFMLDGIPPAPRGVPQIEVKFDIDANGILHVSAKDKTSGREQKITITGSTGISKEDAEKMAKEAEAYAEEDKKKKELVESRNIADSLIYTAEKSLKEAGDKVTDELKKEVEEKVAAAKTAVSGEDVEAIKTAVDALGASLQKIGPAMSQQTPGTDASGASAQEEIPAEEKKDGDAVEGEVVDEKKPE